ncbi:MAG: cell division protein FtsZ [Bacteroidota bacterium]|nr:cell division protein FtsZ [Bacteroidota bacterium]
MQFELPKERPSIIKVIGVGGGGSNAVNYMYQLGIKGVDFLVCNTDHQALDISPVPNKIQLGPSLTEGRGAGALPEVGKNAAIENIEEIKALLRENTKMVFITAGMGGGTGTGAAPIIAGVAREMGILTVAIVTIPFAFEGKKRKAQADAGIEELKKNVDTLLVICNEKLREIHGNLKLTDAFSHADNILAIAAKSIAEIITNTLHINVDFADIQTVMKDSGVAIMGAAIAEGENRALDAVQKALDSPLLNDNEIEGARYILLNITSGNMEVTMDEMGDITDYIQTAAGQTAEVIMGVGQDDSLGDKINVTIIATGFKTKGQTGLAASKLESKIVYNLNDTINKDVQKSIIPVQETAAAPAPVATVTSTPIMEPTLKVIPHASPVPPAVTPVNTTPQEQKIVHFLHEEPELSPVPAAPVQIHPPAVEHRTPEINELVKENDATFVFEISSSVQEPVSKIEIPSERAPEMVSAANVPKTPAQQSNETDPFERAKDRIYQLKAMSMKFNTPTGLSDLEKEPAYKRKNIQLENVPASGETQVSRFTLSSDQDNKPEIKSNNSFLHDRVD